MTGQGREHDATVDIGLKMLLRDITRAPPNEHRYPDPGLRLSIGDKSDRHDLRARPAIGVCLGHQFPPQPQKTVLSPIRGITTPNRNQAFGEPLIAFPDQRGRETAFQMRRQRRGKALFTGKGVKFLWVTKFNFEFLGLWVPDLGVFSNFSPKLITCHSNSVQVHFLLFNYSSPKGHNLGAVDVISRYHSDINLVSFIFIPLE